MRILVLIFLVAVSSGEFWKLKLLKKGQYYGQTMILNQESIEYDVPKHADIEQAQYLYEFDTRMIVIRSDTAKKCYAYDMQYNEAISDEIKAGVLQFHEHFPENWYRKSVKHDIFLLGHLESNNVTPKILKFCGSFPIIESIAFNSTKEVEQFIKDHLLYQTRTNSSRERRTIFLNISMKQFPICDFKKSSDAVTLCSNKGRGVTNLGVTCEANLKLQCKLANKAWQCPIDKNYLTNVLCCNFKCKQKR